MRSGLEREKRERGGKEREERKRGEIKRRESDGKGDEALVVETHVLIDKKLSRQLNDNTREGIEHVPAVPHLY